MKKTADTRLTRFHCVSCSAFISADRIAHKAVTCSKDCAKIYRAGRRAILSEQRQRCRTCNRPGTPAEWAQFRAWQKTLPKQKPGRKKRVPEADPRQQVIPNDLTIH